MKERHLETLSVMVIITEYVMEYGVRGRPKPKDRGLLNSWIFLLQQAAIGDAN